MRDHIALSPLAFGCASVMGKVAKPQAMRAMATAFDLGVTHLDVARSYGFGRAEEVVGSFIKGRRDKVTVASKFGVVAPTLSLRTQALIPIGRALTQLFPSLKARMKKKSGHLLAERNFEVAYARQCLDHSLAALRTDYLDIYLLHEPQAALLHREELRTFMEDSVRAGKIRRWGCAYRSVNDYPWASALGGDVIQFEGNIETLSACAALLSDARQRIVMRPFGGGFEGNKPVLETMLQDMALMETMEKMGASVADVALALSHQLAGKSGTVLCSMFSAAHIKKNAESMRMASQGALMAHILGKLMSSAPPVSR